jgi:hypothetical protein
MLPPAARAVPVLPVLRFWLRALRVLHELTPKRSSAAAAKERRCLCICFCYFFLGVIGVIDPFMLGVTDPFMLAPTSGARFL